MYKYINELMQISHYKIESIIGQGGGGKVYRAFDNRAKKYVAIKEMFSSRFKEKRILRKFMEEANILLELDEHSNINKLTDFIIGDNTAYLVTEFISGKDLEKYILTVSGPIDESRTKKIFFQILDAMDFIHRNNVLHLDIKPSNIILTKDMDVKIIDFGISRGDISNLENTFFEGTPAYMSPEQIEKKQLDHRSDIYSLGVTLFQMVTAKLPYKFKTQLDLYNAIVKKPLLRAKEFYPPVSENMQFLIDKATMKNPEDRFQSCQEFFNDMFLLLN